MKRVACLYLPHWPIDRLRRAERAHAPQPETGPPPIALDVIGEVAAAERASQCSVPKTAGWRPGARWAREQPAGSRDEVEASVAALPAHRRPPQRELGRVSEAAANPFAGTPPDAEAGAWLSPARLDAAIAALPPHQRPSFGELSRRSQMVENPFRPLRPDEAGAHPTVIPIGRPAETGPGIVVARASRQSQGAAGPVGPETGNATLPCTAAAPLPDRNGNVCRRTTRHPGSRSGHGSEAGHLPPLPLSTSLARAAAMPAVRYPGEGPHPDKHGRAASDATAHGSTHGQGRFFQTGRTLGSVVSRAYPERERPAAANPRNSAAPLVTVHKVGARVEIAAACPAALTLGLAPGTALAQARAAVPGLDVRAADPDGDAADLARLANTLARRWTPVVAPSGDDGLLLDLSGVAHLHGGEARMARRLVQLLRRAGVNARVAVADTAGAAWAVARFGGTAPDPGQEMRSISSLPGNGGDARSGSTRSTDRVRGGPQPGGNGRGAPGWSHASSSFGADTRAGGSTRIVPSGAHLAALEPLPPAALRLDPATLELLARLGIDRVGQLLDMPRAPLVRRFGRALVARLDQATGRVPEPLDPVVPRETVAVAQRFAEPIATAEVIAHWLAILVPRLADVLAAAGLGARVVEFVAERVDGGSQRLRLGFARPTRDPAHLLRLAARRIEEIDPGYGIDALALVVRRADPLGPESLAPRLAEEAPPDLAPLIDAIANRIGASRLWRGTALESDVPERSVGTLPPLDPPAGEARAPAADDVRRLDERGRDHPWHPRWPRPALLLRHPERVDHVLAEMPDRPPVRFTWRGRMHLVIRADGPERIAGEWWRRTGERLAIRDYFRVEDEAGERFWLYRRGDGVRVDTGDLAWFVHGRFG